MNLLITGAQGQLGQSFKKVSNAFPQHHFFFTDINELDITDKSALCSYFEKHAINVVINCAAYTNVDAAEEESEKLFAINVEAVRNLAIVAEHYRAKMIQISSDYVFNGKSSVPYVEHDPVSPLSKYGLSKLKSEEEALHHCSRVVIIRTSWLYSEFGHNFLKTMLRLSQEHSEVKVVFDQIGTPTYATDLALAILHIIDCRLVKGVYHYSNEGVCSWYDFARTIYDEMKINQCKVLPLHTVDYPTKAKRPNFSVLDKTKIKQTYNLTIPHWVESLRCCLKEIR